MAATNEIGINALIGITDSVIAERIQNNKLILLIESRLLYTISLFETSSLISEGKIKFKNPLRLSNKKSIFLSRIMLLSGAALVLWVFCPCVFSKTFKPQITH
jgi:hypothetical protein